jgi:hypothetical protein
VPLVFYEEDILFSFYAPSISLSSVNSRIFSLPLLRHNIRFSRELVPVSGLVHLFYAFVEGTAARDFFTRFFMDILISRLKGLKYLFFPITGVFQICRDFPAVTYNSGNFSNYKSFRFFRILAANVQGASS